MTRWLAAISTAAAIAWYDPAGTRWAAIAILAVSLTALAWRLARWDRRRRLRRTIEGLRALPSAEFEAEVGRWLQRDGWRIEHRGGTGDGGIDLIATRRRETLAIQCKRYAETTPVTAAQVRDLYGAAVASGATGAVLVTTGRISRAAHEWCAALPTGPRAILLEGADLSLVAAGARLIR
jgi:restriction system protein